MDITPADSHLDYFQPLAIITKTAINIHVQLFEQDIFSFFSGKYLGVKLLNCKVNI